MRLALLRRPPTIEKKKKERHYWRKKNEQESSTELDSCGSTLHPNQMRHNAQKQVLNDFAVTREKLENRRRIGEYRQQLILRRWHLLFVLRCCLGAQNLETKQTSEQLKCDQYTIGSPLRPASDVVSKLCRQKTHRQFEQNMH